MNVTVGKINISFLFFCCTEVINGITQSPYIQPYVAGDYWESGKIYTHSEFKVFSFFKFSWTNLLLNEWPGLYTFMACKHTGHSCSSIFIFKVYLYILINANGDTK